MRRALSRASRPRRSSPRGVRANPETSWRRSWSPLLAQCHLCCPRTELGESADGRRTESVGHREAVHGGHANGDVANGHWCASSRTIFLSSRSGARTQGRGDHPGAPHSPVHVPTLSLWLQDARRGMLTAARQLVSTSRSAAWPGIRARHPRRSRLIVRTHPAAQILRTSRRPRATPGLQVWPRRGP